MGSKRLSLMIALGCLTVGTAIAGITAVHQYRSAPYSGLHRALWIHPRSAAQSDAGVPGAPSNRNAHSGSAPEGMFFPPDPATPVPAPQTPRLTVTPAAPIPTDPLADYAFTGFVTVDGEGQAVLEQRSTKQNWYVKAGDLWQNYRVVSVSPEQIVLAVDGQQRTLAMNDAFNAVPLLADAPFRKQQEQRARNFFKILSLDGSASYSDDGSALQFGDSVTDLDLGNQTSDLAGNITLDWNAADASQNDTSNDVTAAYIVSLSAVSAGVVDSLSNVQLSSGDNTVIMTSSDGTGAGVWQIQAGSAPVDKSTRL